MLLIPVLDLNRGLVVHAKQGERVLYQAVTSVLSSSFKPEPILDAYLKLYPFKIIYIADLDAIQAIGNHSQLINELALKYQQCEFWVDAGIKPLESTAPNYSANNIKLVLGSENKLAAESISRILKDKPEIKLSLDFTDGGLLENNYLLNDTILWPKQIIVMMLHRVGLNKGIDFECLNKVLELGSKHDIYVAGGIRDIHDLRLLRETNIKGALLASALHSGSITKEDLIQFLDG